MKMRLMKGGAYCPECPLFGPAWVIIGHAPVRAAVRPRRPRNLDVQFRMEAAHALSGREAFKQILDAEGPLVVFATAEPGELVEQFRLLARRSGQAVYHWLEGEGLRSLREGAVPVPGCLRLADTLRYVLQSLHFGVYLLEGVAEPLSAQHQSLFRQIARARTTHVRRVVLMAADTGLTESLDGAVGIAEPQRVQLRLRNGHWVG